MASSVISIPTNRIGDLYIQQRLLSEVGYCENALADVETQLATGHRFQTPSEDPTAAMQVVSLQRLLQRKTQMQSNLSSNQSYLGATDSALTNVSNLVTAARASAISVMGTTATDSQRQAVAAQIGQIITQLVNAGNQTFRSRYIFAGSEATTAPFQVANGTVEYVGNETQLASYGDISQLLDTNVTGAQAFGAISTAVQGAATLSPNLTFNTQLSDLRHGSGIDSGSISITVSEGGVTRSSTVDLSSAATIGDVAALIKTHAPSATPLNVEVSNSGLVIQTVSPSGSVTIAEVGSGKTAAELGILRSGGSRIVGTPLNPVLRVTTSLDNILGGKASVAIHSAGNDNDFLVTADTPGDALNSINFSFQNDGVAGHETVDYNGTAIVVHVQSGLSTAADVVAAIKAQHDAGNLPFTAQLDPLDSSGGGGGPIDVNSTGQTAGGWGEVFDKTSGMQIVNAGKTTTIDLSGAENIQDLLNAINGAGASLQAEINADSTGINVRSRASGCDFAIGENGGTTAAQLGLRTFTDDTRLADLNYGGGVNDWTGDAGTFSSVSFASLGANNDLAFTARNTGPQWDGFAINVSQGAPGATPSLHYDKENKAINIVVAPDTTANQVLSLFANNASGIQDDWSIALGGDGGSNSGEGVVGPGVVSTSGGSTNGVDFYITRADGVQLSVDIAGAKTVGDVLQLINNNPLNADGELQATLSSDGNGIELIDDSVGTGKLAVTSNPMSQAAYDLGLIPSGQTSSNTATAHGTANVVIDSAAPQSGLIFTATDIADGTAAAHVVFKSGAPPGPVYDTATQQLTFGITPGTTTANDIITALAADPTLSKLFSVTLDPADVDPVSGDPNDGSGAVDPTDQPFDTAIVTSQTLTGSDVNPLETNSIFTALLRIQEGLIANNNNEVSRAINMLDDTTINMNLVQADLGAREQGVAAMQDRLSSENVELKKNLSDNYDCDVAQVASDLTSRQVAYAASLKATAMIFSKTLLDYL